jgi:wobble nucleotide-excising tRNase
VDDFCGLPERPDTDDAIQEAERALAAARDQDAVRTTPAFEPLALPDLNLEAIEQVLQQDLPALDSATLARVQAHLADLGEGGESWVADAMHRLPAGDTEAAAQACPFCAQDLRESPLIQHYRAYFSEAYASLKREVSETLGSVNQAHAGEVAAAFERAVRVTVERRQFWSRFCDVAALKLDTAAIVRDWRAARHAVLGHLAAKQAAPLDPMELSDEARGLAAALDAHRTTIATINHRLAEANQAIEVARERVATANSVTLADDLAKLRAVKARHEPQVAPLCDEYLQERAAKEATERQRDQARTELERHRTAVFPGYQTAINLYLARFNADFRLDSVRYANTRGGPTCTYNVLINDVPVAVGGAEPAPGEPSFRNTLSAGDRNTLALAFFFASLEQDSDLADKVVVIDDPISSLDEHRTFTTAQEIRRLADRAGQVIVLAHKKPFLRRLWQSMDAAGRASLEVIRDGAGSTLRTWDVAEDTLTEHDRRHAMLRDYLANGAGDLREVARLIRPHLEEFLRVGYPEHFPPGSTLGQFIEHCRQALGDAQQILEPQAIQELQDINEYARRYHHQGWETESINDGELRGFVTRAVAFGR